jgi:hypothetical protein
MEDLDENGTKEELPAVLCREIVTFPDENDKEDVNK